MDLFSRLITRKFRDINEGRYEEIIRHYREFLLLPEELVLPEISSILLAVDRFSRDIPEELYDTLGAYAGASVQIVYVADSTVFRMIEQSLGKTEAERLKRTEAELGERVLSRTLEKLREIGLRASGRYFFGNKSDDVINIARDFDLLVISRSYGSELGKTPSVSPVVLKIVQHVEKPAIIY
ncbi:hypothetical protein A3L12_03950 [Thermococcus sp. P6]|nr:hypothetical protein A3L12_03950 [Thermococcus sp. P6]